MLEIQQRDTGKDRRYSLATDPTPLPFQVLSSSNDNGRFLVFVDTFHMDTGAISESVVASRTALQNRVIMHIILYSNNRQQSEVLRHFNARD